MPDNYDSMDALLKVHPIETLSYKDIERGISTFHYQDIYSASAGGRRRRGKTISWSRFVTPIGSILQDVWYDVAVKIIYREYDGWLLDALEEWLVEHGSQVYLAGYSKAAKNEMARKQAIEFTVSKQYDNEAWVGFIPFNFKYRKSALEGKVFLKTVSSCCKKPGQISPQITKINGNYYCPHCGRWAPAEILGEGSFDKNLYIKKEG